VDGSCVANLEPAGTECRAAVGSCDEPEYCTGDSADCPPPITIVCGEECLTRTGGYWGTHSWATREVLQNQAVTSCGIEINNAAVFMDGDPVNTEAYGSAIEDICFDGKRYTSREVGYSQQLIQLIRQCTVAAINMSATAKYNGSCDGYTIPENECLEPTCVDGTCSGGPVSSCETDDDCTFTYCSQGGGPTEGCVDNEDCPNIPLLTYEFIPTVMNVCCDELCTGSEIDEEGFEEITESDCIKALDQFNNSEDTFTEDPDLCLLNCADGDEGCEPENCAANSDDCRDASHNNWMNCRFNLEANDACGECGDGFVRGTEECDDGGTTPGDGCDENCMLEPI